MIARGLDLVGQGEERAHVPVLVDAVLREMRGASLPADLAGTLVDATVGAGGHARALLEAFPRVRLVGLDQDPDALELARRELVPFGARATLVHGRLSTLSAALARAGVRDVVGVLLDLGASSLQLDRPERGFSSQA